MHEGACPGCEVVEGGVRIRIKVVPGARRESVAGLLGDRWKLRVSAPPEDGRANQAVIELLAASLNTVPRNLELLSGQTSREKLIMVHGDPACLMAAGRLLLGLES